MTKEERKIAWKKLGEDTRRACEERDRQFEEMIERDEAFTANLKSTAVGVGIVLGYIVLSVMFVQIFS